MSCNVIHIADGARSVVMSQPILPDVSEQVLAATLEIISDGIWDWNALTGHVYRSPGWYRMLGYDVDSLENTVFTWESVIYPDDYERVMAHFEAYISGKLATYKIQYRCVTKSGGFIWIEDRGRIVERTNEGDVTRMIGAHRDIHAEKILLEKSMSESLSLQKMVELRTHELSEINLQLAKKVHEVERLATVDPLTSLANRYYFEHKIETEVSRAKRFNQPLSLIAIDIDHFKNINDDFGHASGDKALVAMANIILKNIREVDTAARWGGDELMIILPNTQLTDATDLAEKLRVLIGELQLEIDTNITASFGVSEYSLGETTKHLMIRTDGALYEAKESGRNLVAVAND